MATVIAMPRLSPTMEEGVLLKWTKKEGDKVSPGDVIAEVETDKANMDFPLEDEGTLLKLLVKEGETVKLGAPVAILGDPGEDVSAIPLSTGDGAPETTAKIPRPSAASASEPVPVPEPGPVSSSPPRSSPLARKLAREAGLDLRTISGTGPHGRVIKRDIEAAAGKPTAPSPTPSARVAAVARPAAPITVAQPRPTAADRTIAASPMRKTIARRLVEAKSTVPHFYVTMDADAAALADFHDQLKSSSEGSGLKVSINDLLVKALALALTRVPTANASWTDQGILQYGRVDIGVAVSVDDGLITPVVRNADQKSIGAIARETADLIARARARKLKPEEFSGGTFSISNMGMYGVREFAAIINPPEPGILAVGALQKRPKVQTDAAGHDSIAIVKQMTLTLSCDHRVVDGSLGAQLLREVVRIVEKPLVMAL